MKRAATLLATALLALAGARCHDTPLCYEGDYIACRCADGRSGFAACAEGGEAYGECACDELPGVQPPDGTGGQGGGGLLPLYVPCEDDAECESGLCYPFNAFGPHCTQPCEDANDCPAPSSGCNGKGVCKTR
jgi:hypothetical protein